MSSLFKRLATVALIGLFNSCAMPQRYVGLERRELEMRKELRVVGHFDYKSWSWGYNTGNISINGVLYMATFKRVGDGWQNPTDVLVSLESVEDALKGLEADGWFRPPLQIEEQAVPSKRRTEARQ